MRGSTLFISGFVKKLCKKTQKQCAYSEGQNLPLEKVRFYLLQGRYAVFGIIK